MVIAEKCSNFVVRLSKQDIRAVLLTTASEGTLPEFYKRHGFGTEHRVMLMGMDLKKMI